MTNMAYKSPSTSPRITGALSEELQFSVEQLRMLFASKIPVITTENGYRIQCLPNGELPTLPWTARPSTLDPQLGADEW